MGNTPKNIKNKIKGFIFKTQSANSRIGKVVNCPTCNMQFHENTTYQIFNLHLQLCLQNIGLHELESQYIQNHVQLPENIKVGNPQQEYLFEKVAVNNEKLEFKWEKKMVMKIPNSVYQKNAKVISNCNFQQKLAWFRYFLQQNRIPWTVGSDWMKIEKNNLLNSSMQAVKKVNMNKEVKIDFIGEKVNDAGGLLRQWMHLVIKQIFSQQAGLFTIANTTDTMYKLKPCNGVQLEYAQNLLNLLGIIIGKAIFQRIPLTCYLDKSLIRQLCGQKITIQDIYFYDKQLYKHWKYLLTNKIQPFGQYFCVFRQNIKNQIQTVNLCQNGESIELIQSNKLLFVELSIKQYCTTRIAPLIAAIQRSLYKIIPQQFLNIFEPHQFQMILYGLPFVNVEDWINHTDYKGAYYKNHQIIKWFWKIIQNLSQQQLGKMLQFCTGSSRIPIFGFKKLQSNRGNYAKFLIQSVSLDKKNPFPKAHTCFNRLQLPMYTSQQMMKTYIAAIVNNDLEGIYGLD